ncbi:regulator of G-protein signaling 19-like isoform X2 [Pomacea canaliculata]|nr:regulator of G-protein signaling 19-like isoform X2 [Pomacea canaliculata]XP_025109464.1 regulator of G-protein signaling 19-like isoform X2 [Pomacea canaliculata]
MSAATVLRRQSSTSNENDVRMRNSRGGTGPGQGPGQSQGQMLDSPPSSPSQPTDRGARVCCFCCLAVKSGANQQERNKEAKLNPMPEKDEPSDVKSRTNKQERSKEAMLNPMPEKDEPPTLEELKCWGESFEKLMKCTGGRKLFREFLRSEYSEENMLFWLACEELKTENNPELVEEKARLIYEDYISILSPKEVSLDSV